MVRREWADVIAAALLDGAGCVPAATGGGRGALMRFQYEQGWGVVRRYLRGGVARHFVKEAHVLVNRPLRELRILAYLFQSGTAVPEPLGVCWDRRGLLVRGALATHEVEAVTLLESLAQADVERSDVLGRCGELVREMHDQGVSHADLQVRNILVGPERLYLVDFDGARRVKRLSSVERARNLFRLQRSIEKNGLSPEFFQRICEGYGIEALPSWLGRLYRVKGVLSDKMAGRAHESPGRR